MIVAAEDSKTIHIDLAVNPAYESLKLVADFGDAADFCIFNEDTGEILL